MFSWDPKKRLSNIRKHGIDFAVAARVFEGVTLTAEDRRFPYGEQRFLTLGVINGVVVFSLGGGKIYRILLDAM
jgi:uncharacterized DUF497 family protein